MVPRKCRPSPRAPADGAVRDCCARAHARRASESAPRMHPPRSSITTGVTQIIDAQRTKDTFDRESIAAVLAVHVLHHVLPFRSPGALSGPPEDVIFRAPARSFPPLFFCHGRAGAFFAPARS